MLGYSRHRFRDFLSGTYQIYIFYHVFPPRNPSFEVGAILIIK